MQGLIFIGNTLIYCQPDIRISVHGQLLPTAQNHSLCTLVQRKGAALVVTLPTYGTATAVWALMTTSCVSNLQREETLISSKKTHTNQRKRAFPESRKKIPEQLKISPISWLPNTGNTSESESSSSIHTTHPFRHFSRHFPETFVQRNFCVCARACVLHNNINPNFTQHLRIK